jgi:hypothetical protein
VHHVLRSASLAAVFILTAAAPAHAGTGANAVLGGVLGATTGVIIGDSLGGPDGAIVGGVVGGALGAAVATAPYRRGYYVVPARPVYVVPHGYGRGRGYGHRGWYYDD